jgi:hypothetical protein
MMKTRTSFVAVEGGKFDQASRYIGRMTEDDNRRALGREARYDGGIWRRVSNFNCSDCVQWCCHRQTSINDKAIYSDQFRCEVLLWGTPMKSVGGRSFKLNHCCAQQIGIYVVEALLINIYLPEGKMMFICTFNLATWG